VITPGRPFWWANPYYRDAIQGLKSWCEASPRRHFLTPHSNEDALKLIKDNLSDRSTDNTNNDQPGEEEFFSRVQKLEKAISAGNNEAIRLMVRAVRKHFDAEH
jgi:hypothetical protein